MPMTGPRRETNRGCAGQRLEELGQESGAEIVPQLQALADEFSISLDRLGEVERISRRQFPVLDGVRGVEARWVHHGCRRGHFATPTQFRG